MSLITFLKKWHNGMTNLSPVRSLRVQMHSNLGAFIGLVFALVYMLIRKTMWYFGIFMFFFCILQLLTYYKSRKVYLETKKIYDDIELENKVKELQLDSEEQ